VHVLFVGRMKPILDNMIGQLEAKGHTGFGTTDDADAERELMEKPEGTYDAVWFGPPIPQDVQAKLSAIATKKGMATASLRCCCPSEVTQFVADVAAMKGK